MFRDIEILLPERSDHLGQSRSDLEDSTHDETPNGSREQRSAPQRQADPVPAVTQNGAGDGVANEYAEANKCQRHAETLPAREGLLWEERRFPTNIVDNPFTGDPRPELDEAWYRLPLNDNIRVSKDYLDELNLTSIYTKDGSEGIASLSVYHSLHCLKKVKRMLFKEHYHRGKSSEAMAREAKHVDHCIEYIRESLMCQPDLPMVTFRWINNTAQHEDKSEFYPTSFDVSMHMCANWEALNSWSGQRMFNLFQVDLLQRPKPEGRLPGSADE
ncbi:hypothetical protein DL767_011488 [Monosporascus sp. MG133]|nr:hypothetical protein DL767_011488 [Monosporascus sp. MG133]